MNRRFISRGLGPRAVVRAADLKLGYGAAPLPAGTFAKPWRPGPPGGRTRGLSGSAPSGCRRACRQPGLSRGPAAGRPVHGAGAAIAFRAPATNQTARAPVSPGSAARDLAATGTQPRNRVIAQPGG